MTDSSEAILSGRKPPFRLLVRAVATDGRPINVRHAVSEGFVVRPEAASMSACHKHSLLYLSSLAGQQSMCCSAVSHHSSFVGHSLTAGVPGSSELSGQLPGSLRMAVVSVQQQELGRTFCALACRWPPGNCAQLARRTSPTWTTT